MITIMIMIPIRIKITITKEEREGFGAGAGSLPITFQHLSINFQVPLSNQLRMVALAHELGGVLRLRRTGTNPACDGLLQTLPICIGKQLCSFRIRSDVGNTADVAGE